MGITKKIEEGLVQLIQDHDSLNNVYIKFDSNECEDSWSVGLVWSDSYLNKLRVLFEKIARII